MFKDISGQRFGILTALELHKDGLKRPSRAARWLCLCDCGAKIVTSGGSLRSGHTKSCGCIKMDAIKASITTHGLSYSREYSIWKQMVQRCTNPKATKSHNYIGRGISVCDRWLSFENFYADMGKCPEKMTLDRVDTNGNYSVENCRWADVETQANNKRTNNVISVGDEALTATQWGRKAGLHPGTIFGRLSSGWEPSVAVSTPAKSSNRNSLAKDLSAYAV